MTSPAPPRRRWFRFSLRTGFVLLTLFCVWLGVQVKWIRDRKEAANGLFATHNAPGSVLFGEYAAPPWSIRVLESPGYSCVTVVVNDEQHPTAADERIKQKMEALFPEADIGFVEPVHGMSGFGFY